MNTKLLLLAISVAAFSSCTTLYKSGQTPDDVYYSPTRLAGGSDGEQRIEQQRDVANNYSYEDRTIRLGINDRRYRYLDYNFSNNPYINDYSYNPYNYGFNYGYYYNPYFWPYPVFSPVFVSPSYPKNNTPRMANLSGYNPVYNNSSINTKTGGMMRSTPVRGYNNTNRGSAVGNVIRQVFTPNNSNSSNNRINNNNNNNSSNNTRTYTPSTNTSSSSSSGSSSSGSGGGGVSRPPRN